MNYSQTITLIANITVKLNVPELQTKEQLNQWIKSEAARIHFIDHLKPSSFNKLEVIKAASKANYISQPLEKDKSRRKIGGVTAATKTEPETLAFKMLENIDSISAHIQIHLKLKSQYKDASNQSASYKNQKDIIKIKK